MAILSLWEILGRGPVFNGSRARIDNVLFFICALFMCLTCALRYETGADWENYLSYFNTCIISEGEYEWGFSLLNRIFYNITGNYYVLQFILCVFCCSVVYSYIKKVSRYPLLTLFIYYTFFFLSVEMAQLRQFVAMSIIICGMPYVAKKKIYLWLLIVILAMQFHVTAIVAFPLYFTTYKAIGWKTASVICFISIIVSIWGYTLIHGLVQLISHIGILPHRLYSLADIYLNSNTFGQKAEFGSGLGYFVLQIFIVIIIITYMRSNMKYDYFLFNFVIALLFDAAGRNLGELFRLANYYYICGAGICAYNLLVDSKNEVKEDGQWVTGLICIAFVALRLYSFIANGIDDVYLPYRSVLF